MQIADILSHPKAVELGKLKFPELPEGQTYKLQGRQRGERFAERTWKRQRAEGRGGGVMKSQRKERTVSKKD